MTHAHPDNVKVPIRVMAWGTYDLSKPRVRILLEALRLSPGIRLSECHTDIWGGANDKSQITGAGAKLHLALKWLAAYPGLIWRFFRQPKPDLVFVGYLGQFDVLVLWLFARLRGTPIVWDAFLSLYNTIVEDRRMLSARHPLARLLYRLEWLACRASRTVLLDTRAHADYFVERFGLERQRTDFVFVGAEPGRFDVRPARSVSDRPFTVLFYGQFIPLHGIPTIIEAARLLERRDIHWVLIGKGQEAARVANMLQAHPLAGLEWISWVRYEELIEWIARADVCLGIFDAGGKASRVIPNKAFQILAAGKPLITRDSPAIRELVGPDAPGVILVPPDDPQALADAVVAMTDSPPGERLHADLRVRFSLPTLAHDLAKIMSDALRNTP